MPGCQSRPTYAFEANSGDKLTITCSEEPNLGFAFRNERTIRSDYSHASRAKGSLIRQRTAGSVGDQWAKQKQGSSETLLLMLLIRMLLVRRCFQRWMR